MKAQNFVTYVIFNVVINIHGASNVLLLFINFMPAGHVDLRTKQNHALTPIAY